MLYTFALPIKADKVPAGPDWLHEVKLREVEQWLYKYFASGNLPNSAQTREVILSWYYAPIHQPSGQTISFKQYLTVDQLLTERYKFIARWPVRNYRLRAGSTSVNVRADEWVDVTGIVDWTCSSPERQATSVGSEQFTFKLHVETPGVFTILVEDAQVITRTVSGGDRAINARAPQHR